MRSKGGLYTLCDNFGAYLAHKFVIFGSHFRKLLIVYPYLSWEICKFYDLLVTRSLKICDLCQLITQNFLDTPSHLNNPSTQYLLSQIFD